MRLIHVEVRLLRRAGSNKVTNCQLQLKEGSVSLSPVRQLSTQRHHMRNVGERHGTSGLAVDGSSLS